MSAVWTLANTEAFASIVGAFDGHELTTRHMVESLDTGVRQKIDPKLLTLHQASALLPKLTSSLADFLGVGPWATSALWKTLRLRSAACSELPMSNGLLGCELKWGTRYVADPEEGTIYLPWRGSFRPQVRRMQVWRQLGTGSAPTAAGPGTSDIGGTKVDTAGDPVDAIVAGGVLVATGTLDTLAASKATEWTNAVAAIGRLNSSAIFGFPSYSLRCLDWSTEHDHDEYETVSVSWQYDALYHCEQVAARDPDGASRSTRLRRLPRSGGGGSRTRR